MMYDVGDRVRHGEKTGETMIRMKLTKVKIQRKQRMVFEKSSNPVRDPKNTRGRTITS